MRKIILMSAMLLTGLTVLAQHTISGKVKDAESGESLVGASVILRNSTMAMATNEEGEFSFQNVTDGNYTLVLRMVGFTSYERSIEITGNLNLNISLDRSTTSLADVIVTGTRATEKTPTTFTNVSSEEIRKQNLGQDLPFLLNWIPSVVTTSDAGAGIGYTGIRIRGSDPTRINVTINGIPVNDSESQGVFWVNTPDFASSAADIQVQRGVGTSTNGAGAFGGSINILTNGLSQEAKAEVNTSVGSFNTQKYNAIFSTGLLKDRWAFEGRLSQITSDGFVDRASSDLQSYYLSGGYFGKKTSVKFITFGGDEVTYQSWYGTPEARLRNDAAGIEAVIVNNGFTAAQAANLRNSGRSYNFYEYDNQVDDYGQDHYQLHMSHNFSAEWNMSLAGHYTKGGGFFEEFRNDDDLADYGIADVVLGGATVSSSDLIRRRWLDNDFYGLVYDLNYSSGKVDATFGGAINEYIGDHFGEVIWARFAGSSNIRERYYESTSEKVDFNSYLKINYQANEKLNLFGDLQYRTVDYNGLGVDNDLRPIDFDKNFNFFNPKVGATYQLNNNASLYASFAIGNKEPNRSDIIDATSGVDPKHETLNNLEIGYKRQSKSNSFEANFYLMDYRNQFVLTGEVNDVGAGVRTNVPDSYRMGIELSGIMKLTKGLYWSANVALSQNRIKTFDEIIFDFGPAFDEFNEVRTTFTDTDISFSPSVVAGSQLAFIPTSGLEVALLSKYVGDQFLDNTSNEARKIDAFFVNDLRINYAFETNLIKEVSINLLVNNLLNTEYESNGYTFGYFGGQSFEVRENYFYPQAGTNFLLSLGLSF
ncbi:TonB-dependent receptor [Roseivirga sp. E12]|uniref:TonB-dependent receptor n=1 Tax=Roseivirga sp. E12 TaxID=2819237 RepID=UPI001ABC0DC9|nr:TonB-dependent receptor [Roseivirga sp. E12]MBO3699371.1 TonB-dependent receptor [Roseivirga sp. E12]